MTQNAVDQLTQERDRLVLDKFNLSREVLGLQEHIKGLTAQLDTANSVFADVCRARDEALARETALATERDHHQVQASTHSNRAQELDAALKSHETISRNEFGRLQEKLTELEAANAKLGEAIRLAAVASEVADYKQETTT